jgi:hypothetical protein
MRARRNGSIAGRQPPPPAIAERLNAETALWAVDTARRVIEEFHRLAGEPPPDWV